MLTKRRGTVSSKKDDFDNGVMLLQFEPKPKKKKFRKKCHNCDKWGHKAADCTAGSTSGGADDNASTGARSTGTRSQSGRALSSAQFFQEYMSRNISDR